MSSKRRNFVAVCLLLLAAICWALGQEKEETQIATTEATTAMITTPTTYKASTFVGSTSNVITETNSGELTMPVSVVLTQSTHITDVDFSADVRAPEIPRAFHLERLLRAGLTVVAIVLGLAAIFLLSPTAPMLGPDGIGLPFVLFVLLNGCGVFEFSAETIHGILAFCTLLAVRELFGWLRARCTLAWCMVFRLVFRQSSPQAQLFMFTTWISVAFVGCVVFPISNFLPQAFQGLAFAGCAWATIFGVICLTRYGFDFNHLTQQLENYRTNKAITVKSGMFAATEASLADIQHKHTEAVEQAVRNERFKVDLIANVSHDLRTPLTAILGYGELLEHEKLSSEGVEQLGRLQQKAGYMRELLDALFELTKVSSGILAIKRDEIDLIRLLEQTVGLLDDRLEASGLAVRRTYTTDSIRIVTDGTRMHQVFANLLENAIKYALVGTRIYIEVRESEQSYLVRIVNTASYEMDFSPEEITERFARGDKARSTQGSGLGLAIAQTYTESVGGTFRVAIDGDQFSAIVELPKTDSYL